MNNNIKDNIQKEHPIEEMKAATKKGISVSVDGIPYEAYQPEALALVLEETVYMKDYIADAQGKITQIIYDKISEAETK